LLRVEIRIITNRNKNLLYR